MEAAQVDCDWFAKVSESSINFAVVGGQTHLSSELLATGQQLSPSNRKSQPATAVCNLMHLASSRPCLRKTAVGRLVELKLRLTLLTQPVPSGAVVTRQCFTPEEEEEYAK